MKKIDKHEAKRLYESGKTKKEISVILGVGKSTISMALKEFGLTEDLNNIKVDETEFRKLHSEGKTALQISKLMCINKATSHNLHTKFGLVPNILSKEDRKAISDSRKLFNPTKEELEELRKTKTYEQISEEFGVSSVTIYKRLKDFGIV